MFLNNISIYTLPIIGILFALISITYSKTIHLFSYQLSQKSVNTPMNESYISIQVNPLDSMNHFPSTLLAVDNDDDDDLIRSDMCTTNFGDNDSIELRLDQDTDD